MVSLFEYNLDDQSIFSFNICMLVNFSFFSCCLLTFFKTKLFQKVISGTLSESYSLDPDQTFSVLIWVQTDCKGYQQKTKVAASKERVNVQKSNLSLQ